MNNDWYTNGVKNDTTVPYTESNEDTGLSVLTFILIGILLVAALVIGSAVHKDRSNESTIMKKQTIEYKIDYTIY